MNNNSLSGSRIGIDARFYGPLGKGLGRYTQEIVDRVTTLDRKNYYVVFLSHKNFDEFVSENPRVKKVLADVHWYGLAEQIIMPRLIAQEKIDLMHFPHFNVPIFCPTKFVVTIHDLILTKFPTTRASTLGPVKYFLKNIAYRFVINRAIQRSEKVIAVSHYTKDDIISQFNVDPKKIIMIYEGVAGLEDSTDKRYAAKLKSAEILSGYCILEPYLLYVGNAYPHKNLEMLVSVFLKLRKKFSDLKLVLVGRDDYFYLRLKEFAQKESSLKDFEAIIFPGYVPDEDLQTLFKHAALYVFPSKYEGFGLPPLEAMSYGCPVVSSNATCLPEIMENAAIYFNPHDEKKIVSVIQEILSDQFLRSELVKKGYEQIKKYNWENAAHQTVTVYQGVLDDIS
ncbi:MAG TPA: glycosyltransferase family 1 protein [bacterium]|nr:glycosyltransferase family 1 protein [bacterium]